MAVVAAVLIGSAGLPAATVKKKKHSQHAAAARKPVKRKAAKGAAKGTAKGKVAKGKSPARRTRRTAAARPAWRPGQTAPTQERYKEIQNALARKGYLHAEPSGVWDQNSTEALRRFQQDQNLQASGKLDSLSIIALGLGPKH